MSVCYCPVCSRSTSHWDPRFIYRSICLCCKQAKDVEVSAVERGEKELHACYERSLAQIHGTFCVLSWVPCLRPPWKEVLGC